jgi:hypothetical protein
MFLWLAYAERSDLSGPGWQIVLLILGAIAVTAVLALVPIAVARARSNPWAEQIIGACILWALATAGTATYLIFLQFQTTKEDSLLLKTGYYDPRSAPPPPAWPWALGTVFTLVYAAVFVLAWIRRDKAAAG